MNRVWLERERHTARLIRALYDEYLPKSGRASSSFLYALCKLTWITRGGGNPHPDNTAAVVAPALSSLLGLRLTARSRAALAKELRGTDVPNAIVTCAAHPIGFVNYFPAFRNIAREWLEDNRAAVWKIVGAVARADNEAAVRDAYAAIDLLPLLPRPGAGDGKPSNLLTPLLACLHPEHRAPIVNGGKRWLLRKLRRDSSTVAEQYDGLVNLFGQAAIGDAIDLDVADEADLEAAMSAAPVRPKAPSRGKRELLKSLADRHDEDVESLRSADTVKMRRLHNTMTNALLAIGKRAGLAIKEGSRHTCLFDALIPEYRAADRHLLVELKTDDSMPMCRMAVGQLLDYRRYQEDRAAIDLAVLFPAKPSKEARSFLGAVRVMAIWFEPGMKTILGDVTFGRRK